MIVSYARRLPEGLATFLACAALSVAQATAEPVTRLAVSGETRSGDYGLDERTDEYRVTLDASFSLNRVLLYANLPYIWVDGPAGATSASSAAGTSGRFGLSNRRGFLQDADTTSSQSADGFGDGLIGSSLLLTPLYSPAELSVFAEATLPIGDEEMGLGTGATDVSVGASGGYTLSATTLLLTGGYTFVGSTDGEEDGSPLDASQDYAFASLGLSHWFSGGAIVSTGLNWAEAANEDQDPPVSLSLNGLWPVSDTVSFLSYGHAGLTEASADYGLGFGLMVTPRGRN